MSHWITQLRKKPKAVRSQVAFIGAIIVTSLVTTVWWFGTSATPVRTVATKADESSSFSFLREETAAQFARVTDSFKSLLFEATTTDEVVTAATSSANTERPPAIIMPDLSGAALPERNQPTERPILIGTSSPKAASSTTE